MPEPSVPGSVTLRPRLFTKLFTRSERRLLRRPITLRTLMALERWARKKALSFRREGEGVAFTKARMEREHDRATRSVLVAVSFYWASDERLGEGRVSLLPSNAVPLEIPVMEPLVSEAPVEEGRA